MWFFSVASWQRKHAQNSWQFWILVSHFWQLKTLQEHFIFKKFNFLKFFFFLARFLPVNKKRGTSFLKNLCANWLYCKLWLPNLDALSIIATHIIPSRNHVGNIYYILGAYEYETYIHIGAIKVLCPKTRNESLNLSTQLVAHNFSAPLGPKCGVEYTIGKGGGGGQIDIPS
jgi:hypothetical protein